MVLQSLSSNRVCWCLCHSQSVRNIKSVSATLCINLNFLLSFFFANLFRKVVEYMWSYSKMLFSYLLLPFFSSWKNCSESSVYQPVCACSLFLFSVVFLQFPLHNVRYHASVATYYIYVMFPAYSIFMAFAGVINVSFLSHILWRRRKKEGCKKRQHTLLATCSAMHVTVPSFDTVSGELLCIWIFFRGLWGK